MLCNSLTTHTHPLSSFFFPSAIYLSIYLSVRSILTHLATSSLYPSPINSLLPFLITPSLPSTPPRLPLPASHSPNLSPTTPKNPHIPRPRRHRFSFRPRSRYRNTATETEKSTSTTERRSEELGIRGSGMEREENNAGKKEFNEYSSQG